MDERIRSMTAHSERWDREGDRAVTVDLRADIAECASLADLVTKVVAVQGHREFPKLCDHLELVVGHQPFVQRYFTKREDQNANKVFELYLGTLALLVGESITMDPPKTSKGTNPDVITRFKNRNWAWRARSWIRTTRTATLTLIKGVKQIDAAASSPGVPARTRSP